MKTLTMFFMAEAMAGCIYKDIQFIQLNYFLLKQNMFILAFCLVGFVF